MEFGIFNSVFVHHSFVEADPEGAEHRRIREEVELVKAADRSGFKYAWSAEHHFLTEYSHLSASECFMAYAAALTERIHLGSGIFNITPPVNPPVRVAERVAMLDHLSEGRFEFGVGRGSSSTEQRGFGIEEPELTKEMLDEVVGEFKRMWRETEYSYEGRFFSVPPRNVLPKPYTKPHPPMWIAAGNPGTFEKAARMGLGVLCFTMGTPDRLAPLIEIYKNTIEKAEPVGEYVNDNVMMTTGLLCLEDGQKARQVAQRMSSRYHASLVFRYLDTFPKPPEIPDWPAVLPEPTAEELDARIAAGEMTVGTPEEVERAVAGYAAIGADQLVFAPLTTTIPIELAVETIETFGRHVLPRFDRDPVHRTTRHREQHLKAHAS